MQENLVKEMINELGYLRYFYELADFGPADSDVREGIERSYVRNTGNNLPYGYGSE